MATLPRGASFNQQTYAGHIWLVTDKNQRNLAVFRAVKQKGRAIIGTADIITDPNLAVVIRDTLGLAPNEPITKQALKKINRA